MTVEEFAVPQTVPALKLVTLTPPTARYWVEAGPEVPNPGEITAQVRAFLRDGHPGALFAVVQGDRPVARLQGAPVGSCGLGLFAAGFAEGLATETTREAAELLIEACEGLVAQFPATRYLETDVPASAPLPAAWSEALTARGLEQVAETYTYALTLAGPPPVPPLALLPADDLPDDQVLGVYEAAYRDTADESHRSSPESFAVKLERAKTIPLLAPERSGWLIAFEGDQPAGLVFASLETEPYGSPKTGWIVEIGVVPEARGRGLSKGLLAAGLESLALRGATEVLARIDVHNTPSVRLHEGAGFTRQAGASRMYRKVWSR